MIKWVSLYNLLFQIRSESQSASLPYSRQAIKISGRVEGLESAANSWSLYNRGNPASCSLMVEYYL